MDLLLQSLSQAAQQQFTSYVGFNMQVLCTLQDASAKTNQACSTSQMTARASHTHQCLQRSSWAECRDLALSNTHNYYTKPQPSVSPATLTQQRAVYLPKVRHKSSQSRPKVSPKSTQSRPEVGTKLARSRPKVVPKSAHSRPTVGPKSSKSRPKVGQK